MARRELRACAAMFMLSAGLIASTQAAAAGPQTGPYFLPAAIHHTGGTSAAPLIAAADINGDGAPDLLMTTCATADSCGLVAVMLANGNGTFRDAMTFASGGKRSSAIAIADLNLDQLPDLVVGHLDSDMLGILLGRGDGTFEPALARPSGTGDRHFGTTALAASDISGDAIPDLVVANAGGDVEATMSVLLGAGDGTFRRPLPVGSGSVSPNDLVIADMNSDGRPDLAVSHGSSSADGALAGTVSVLLGDGKGRFQGARAYGSGNLDARSVAVSDLNADGSLDVIVGHSRLGAVGLLLGNGDGTLQPARLADPAVDVDTAGAVGVADVNGDRRPDLLVATCSTADCRGAVFALLGNGDGSFQPPAAHNSGGFGAGRLAAADVNGDTRTDVMVTTCTDATCDTGAIGVLLNAAETTQDSRDLDTVKALSTEEETVAMAALTTASAAGSYNLRIITDGSPDLTDLDSLVRSITSTWPASRDKVWALFYWSRILKRQSNPMVLHGFEVTDPIRNFTDYGFTQCSTISGINQSLYESIGLRHQYWDICNHTVSNVEYDGAFHMVDSSMSNLVTTDDGVTLASVTQAAANSARLVKERSLYSTSPYGFLTGSDTARSLPDYYDASGNIINGYASTFCEANLRFRDYYYNWNTGHRYVLNLRSGESYTRYYRRLGETQDYWVGSETVSNPNPANTHQIDAENRFGLRGNGMWTFTPSLAADGYASAAYSSNNITVAATGGLRPTVTGQATEVVYKVQAANAIASQKIQAQFARANTQSSATISLSLNHGATWTQVGSTGTALGTVPVTVNLRNEVSGAYETLIRIQMTAGSSTDAIVLKALTVDTVTHVNAKALPKLNIGKNQIYVGAGDQSETMVLWPDLRGELWKKDVYSYSNIASTAVPTTYTAVVYPAVLTQEAYLVYRMQAPSDITRIVYGGRLYNFAAGSSIDFLHSFDGGSSWIKSYTLTDVNAPYDDIHYETVTVPSGVRTVLFKFVIHNTNGYASRASGFYSLRMEASHRPAGSVSSPIDVTLRWKEVQANRALVERTHRQRVTTFPYVYTVNTGGMDHPVMEFIKVNLADSGDSTPFGYSGGTDPGGQKYIYTKQTDGTNYAQGRPYTYSINPTVFQGSAPAGNYTILTNGVVGPPVTGGTAYWWGQCWNAGPAVDLQVDLGSTRSVAAFRAHLFGYPFWDALKGEVQDQVEILTSTDGSSFTSRGFLQTELWKKDIPINYMLQDDEKATAWNFERTLPAAVSARYVRFRMTPARITCVSELQVLNNISRQPFDIGVSLPGAVVIPNVTVPQVTGLTQSAAVAAIAAADLTTGTITTASSATVPAGIVISQNPSAGASVPPGSAVSLVVSSGPSAPPPTGDNIVIHLAGQAQILGGWTIVSDSTAAGGARLQNPDLTAPKLATPLAAPTRAFDVTFNATAGIPYHLWLRGKAEGDQYYNDSFYVQFDGSVTEAGAATWRIGTTSATTVVLEDCSGCGLAGWGWADNGWAELGPAVYFAQTGTQRIRIQAREDGVGLDQLVLSPSTYLATSPGATKNDTTILPPTTGSGPVTVSVPNIVGLTQAAATTTLTNAGLTVGAVTTASSSTVPAGSVISQNPTAGTSVAAGSSVAFVVSSGPPAPSNVQVPNVVGLTQAAATTTLTNAGLAVGAVTTASSSTVPAGSVISQNPAAGTSVAPGSSVALVVSSGPATPPSGDTVVIHVAGQAQVIGGWNVVQDATAAGGARLQNPNLGVPKLATPLASPTLAFDVTFNAAAGVPYHLWLRGKAIDDYYGNDSFYVQFDGSVTEAGTPTWRIGTTSATTVVLEACDSCGIQGWGWTDNGWAGLGPAVYFAQTGTQRIRIQAREDGIGLDQIVLSPSTYLNTSPGATKNDTTILPATGSGPVTVTVPNVVGLTQAAASSAIVGAGLTVGTITTTSSSTVAAGLVISTSPGAGTSVPLGSAVALVVSSGPPVTPPSGNDIVLYVAADAQVIGGWNVVADPTAAGGARLQNPDLGAPKVGTPLAAPTLAFDVTFNATAGIPYHLWLRGRAEADHYWNDSLNVQFDGSVTEGGTPTWRIGTTSATTVVLEDCSGCPLQGWGWSDNGYATMGPAVYFAQTGTQKIRIQVREDGVSLDQIVISPSTYLNTAPGAPRNDSTIVPKGG